MSVVDVWEDVEYARHNGNTFHATDVSRRLHAPRGEIRRVLAPDAVLTPINSKRAPAGATVLVCDAHLARRCRPRDHL